MILEPDDAKRISASVFRLTSTAPFPDLKTLRLKAQARH